MRTIKVSFVLFLLLSVSSVFGQAILTDKSEIAVGGSAAMVSSNFDDRVSFSGGVAGDGLLEAAFSYTSAANASSSYGLAAGIYPLSLDTDSLRLQFGAIGGFVATAGGSAASVGPAMQASLPLASRLRLIPSVAVAKSWSLQDTDYSSTLFQYGLSLAVRPDPRFWFTVDFAGASNDRTDPVFTYGFSLIFMQMTEVEDVWDF